MNRDIFIIFTVSFFTILLRFLPFIVFPEGKTPPKVISYLSTVLPSAVIGMLVIYCIKDISFTVYPFAIPEVVAILLVIGTYVWKRKVLISILLGTACYMLLMQWYL